MGGVTVYFGIPGVDAYDRCTQVEGNLMREVAGGGNGRAGADLDHQQPLGIPQPLLKPVVLGTRSLFDPLAVAEHQDIWAGQAAAMPAAGRLVQQQAIVVVDFRKKIRAMPDVGGTGVQALKMMNRAMALDDLVGAKAGFVEMAVHVRSEAHA